MPRRFVEQRRRDPYYRAARREGLRSRAAYKLDYLAERFPIFRPGDRVLDLGAAPGGWSLVAADRVGRRGTVTALDPRPIEPIEGVEIVRGRVGDPRLDARWDPASFDVVISDMSPSISGAYATDHARSVELVLAALRLADHVLAPGGAFAAKLFDGDLRPEVDDFGRPRFARWTHTKPPASRSGSSELYVIGIGYHRARVAPASRDGPNAPPA
jgi:23S rRNA (uridine2552-2'-O)-methyltransferase